MNKNRNTILIVDDEPEIRGLMQEILTEEGYLTFAVKNAKEAQEMLQLLSGTSHEVISSICVTTSTQQLVDHDLAKVYFRTFTSEEITHYINTYQPFDKAGAYGIQEWIGHVALQKLEGSYNTVMGLPTQKLYDLLHQLQ